MSHTVRGSTGGGDEWWSNRPFNPQPASSKYPGTQKWRKRRTHKRERDIERDLREYEEEQQQAWDELVALNAAAEEDRKRWENAYWESVDREFWESIE